MDQSVRVGRNAARLIGDAEVFLQYPVAAGKGLHQRVCQVAVDDKTLRRFYTRFGLAALPAAAGAEVHIFIRGGHDGRIVP